MNSPAANKTAATGISRRAASSNAHQCIRRRPEKRELFPPWLDCQGVPQCAKVRTHPFQRSSLRFGMATQHEVWLRNNARAVRLGLALPVVLLLIGMGFALAPPSWAKALGVVLIALSLVLSGLLVWYGRVPRLAYDGRHLLVYLRSRGPVAVPIEVVECFLLGSGLHTLPGGREVQTSHLSVRLAERVTEWAQIEVKPALGKWCGGYITIYGMWCEPLTLELVRRLNTRLAEAQQAQSAHRAYEPIAQGEPER